MGSKAPDIGAARPDLVAVILDRSVAQQLALALAWALGSTGGGKSKGKGSPKTPSTGETPGAHEASGASGARPGDAAPKHASKKASVKRNVGRKGSGTRPAVRKPTGLRE